MPEGTGASTANTATRTFKGLFNPETNEFVDCNTQQILYLLDSTQMISSEAKKLTASNSSVYVELSGLTFSSDSIEVGSSYDSVVLVHHLNSVKSIDQQSTCVLPENVNLLTLKEFGCDKLEFSRRGLFAQSDEIIGALLPGFTQHQSSMDSDEATYEYRRGFGTITFVTDTTNTVSEATFLHPSSNDQYQVRIGMTLADAQKLRPKLKMVKADAEDAPAFSSPTSHIFYIIDMPKDTGNDAANIDFATTKIVGLVWRKQACN